MKNSLSELNFSKNVFLLFGLLGTVVVGAGEYLLHFSPAGPEGEITMLLNVPLERARAGHFLAICGVPLYFLGYYGILKVFEKSSQLYAKVLFLLGIASFTVGGFWITSRYYAAVVLQKTQGTELYEYFLAQYDHNYQVLVWALRVLVLLLSTFYILCILNSKTVPNWAAIFNPIVLLILTLSTLAWARPLGIHIAPIAMNTAHFLMFLKLISFSIKNRDISQTLG